MPKNNLKSTSAIGDIRALATDSPISGQQKNDEVVEHVKSITKNLAKRIKTTKNTLKSKPNKKIKPIENLSENNNGNSNLQENYDDVDDVFIRDAANYDDDFMDINMEVDCVEDNFYYSEDDDETEFDIPEKADDDDEYDDENEDDGEDDEEEDGYIDDDNDEFGEKRKKYAKLDRYNDDDICKNMKIKNVASNNQIDIANIVTNETKGVKYSTISNIESPNFFNHVYCIKRLTPNELPFFKAQQFQDAFLQFRIYQQKDSQNGKHRAQNEGPSTSKGASSATRTVVRENQYYNFKTKSGYELCMCQYHGPTVQNLSNNDETKCETCVPFLSFSYSFVMETSVHLFTFPMPTIFTPQLVNFFRSIVSKATENQSATLELQMAMERTYYTTFINKKFVGGNLVTIIAGKNSWMRKKMLAFPTHGIRMTLTVHSELGPHYVRIPRKLYESHELATPLAIVNRSPSINSRCIYVVEVTPQDTDDTIHLNPYILDGLHADQDGDDIQVFLFLKKAEVPSFEMDTCIKELRNMSWKYGKRHDCTYVPRYTFSQYHRFLLHHKSDYFTKNSKLWASIRGTPIQKAKIIMNLGCSIMPREVDEFIDLVGKVTKNLGFHTIGVTDILNGNGQMMDIVESEAKGTRDHIEMVTNNLMRIPDDFESTMIEKGFNKFVNSSWNMSREGVAQFTMLYAYNSIALHLGNYQLNGGVILRDDQQYSLLTNQLHYNNDSVNFVFESLLDDPNLKEVFAFDDYDKDLAELFTDLL